MNILVLNGGSSSIKFSIYAGHGAERPQLLFNGQIDGIGGAKLGFAFQDASGRDIPVPLTTTDPVAMLESAICGPGIPAIDAVGYRVVHPGPSLNRHQRITDAVLQQLEQAVDYAPLHDPGAIALIKEMEQKFPQARHYACFDTVFYETMPVEASTYAIPAEFRRRGVRRYGFHGTVCESVVDELRTELPDAFPHRLVIAHLGSGCSVTALVDGKAVDTSMGLTPTGGVVMGTRPGDLDPGLVLYLLRHADGDGEAAVRSVEALLNHQAGLVALSGLPNDMRALRQATSADARLALDVFTRSVRKAIGSYAFLLRGLDAIAFSGGIGEHDAKSRQEILDGLESYGVTLDTDANQAGRPTLRRISRAESQVAVWIVPADEDRMIAMHVCQMASEEKS